MVGSLLVLVLATAVFSVGVVARCRRVPVLRAARGTAVPAREQLASFVFVGAGALVLLGVTVVVLGWALARAGAAEALAVVGLMAYLLYLTVALLWTRRAGGAEDSAQGRRRRRRTASPAANVPAAAPTPPAPSNPSRAARRPVR